MTEQTGKRLPRWLRRPPKERDRYEDPLAERRQLLSTLRRQIARADQSIRVAVQYRRWLRRQLRQLEEELNS